MYLEDNSIGLNETVGPDDRLPSRLFATNRYPDARFNVYSKQGILSVVQGVLKGTTEFEIL